MRSAAWAQNDSVSKAASARRRKIRYFMMRSASERQQGEEEALQPAHARGLVDETAALVLDARIGDLRRLHGVRGRDVVGIDHAGEADELVSLIDRHLLLARHQQVAVGENVDDGDRDGAGESV